MSVAFRIARRELRGGLKGFRVFLACLALGVAAISAIGLVRAGIEAGLNREGAAILGGDASVKFTYRFADQAERAWLDNIALETSEIADFRSMLVAGEERSLTQVKAVDGAYPLYGQIRLSPDMPLADALAGSDDIPGIVVDPLLIDRLGLSIGNTVQLGVQEFVLTAALDFAPDEAGGGFSLGPRSIVAKTALEGSGLIQTGSLFDTEYRMRLDPGSDLGALQRRAEAELTGIQWRDRRNAAPGIAEFVDRLSAFLVLVGLTGLAVGGVGVAAAVQSYMREKTAVIATLRSIGADARTIFTAYLLQIGALALVGICLGLVLGAAVPLILAPVIEDALPIPAEFTLKARPLLEAALYGVLSAALFALWPLARAETVRAAALFRETHGDAGGRPRNIWIVVSGIILALLIGVAAWLSGLPRLTLWVAGGIFAAFVVLMIAAWLAQRLAGRLALGLQSTPVLRAALSSVANSGSEARSVVLSLGLGLTVLAAVGQIQWNLDNAISRDLPEVAPSYFVVDIQNDQLSGLLAQFEANNAISNVETAPMLRGVITRINDRPAREIAGDHWVLQGDRGITYSAAPTENTKITEGNWWGADYEGAPQISFAAEEAEEMGLSLGDSMTINVLGRDITGEITSFRDVDFSTAGIGFVLSMNPSALSGAPHTHIATVYSDEEAEAQILRDMARAYPNITAIRVRDAIDRVSLVLSGIAAAITYGALATLLTGGVVLIGTAAAGERARVYEGAILKTLGASRRTILINFALRSAYLGLTAGVIAIAAGITAGWAVTRFVMGTDYQIEPTSIIVIVLGGILATLISGLAFAWRPLMIKPAQILRSRE